MVFVNNLLICSGSKIGDSSSVEIWDKQNDFWKPGPRLNEGRYLHGSCAFNNRYCYIFGGNTDGNKKTAETIEFIDA